MESLENSPQLKKIFFWEADRLASFVTWPFDDTKACNKAKMAEAGFFWCGSKTDPDTAACFACGKQLDGWEEQDDPWKEHINHAPQCVFVKLHKAEENMTVILPLIWLSLINFSLPSSVQYSLKDDL